MNGSQGTLKHLPVEMPDNTCQARTMILRGPRLQMEWWVYQVLHAVQGDGSGDACHLKNPHGTQDVLSMAMQEYRESYTKDCPVQRLIKNE